MRSNPFSRLEKVFKEMEIRIDSSVFSGGHFEAGEYSFDFRTASKKSNYRFSNDVCVEDQSGYFKEYPISSRTISTFIWENLQKEYGVRRIGFSGRNRNLATFPDEKSYIWFLLRWS